MRQTVIRYSLFCTALLVIGPLAWWQMHGLVDADGGQGTTLLNSASAFGGLVRGLIVLVLAAVAGVAAARWNSLKAGLLDAGVVLAWGAAGLGSVVTVMRANAGNVAGMYQRMAVESGLLAVAGVALAWLIGRVAVVSKEEAARIDRGDGGEPRVAQMALAIAVAVLGAAAGVWLVAQSTLKGQAIGGAAMGGVVAGAAGFMVERRLAGWVPVAGVMVVAVVAPLALSMMNTGGGLAGAVLSGAVLPWGRLTPFDYLAGAFMGSQLGLSAGGWVTGWAHNTVEAHGAR